jgi:hypothetical protein
LRDGLAYVIFVAVFFVETEDFFDSILSIHTYF